MPGDVSVAVNTQPSVGFDQGRAAAAQSGQGTSPSSSSAGAALGTSSVTYDADGAAQSSSPKHHPYHVGSTWYNLPSGGSSAPGASSGGSSAPGGSSSSGASSDGVVHGVAGGRTLQQNSGGDHGFSSLDDLSGHSIIQGIGYLREQGMGWQKAVKQAESSMQQYNI